MQGLWKGGDDDTWRAKRVRFYKRRNHSRGVSRRRWKNLALNEKYRVGKTKNTIGRKIIKE